MEIHMMDNGKLTKPTDLVFIIIIQVQYTKDIGLKIFKMGLEFKFGLTTVNIKELISMVKNMETENIHGQMEVTIKENGIIIKSKVVENIFGAMVEVIKAIGKIIKCMDTECIFGKTVEDTKETM